MERLLDPRIPLIKKVLGIIIPKTFLSTNPDIMVTSDNRVVVVVLDTTIYTTYIKYQGDILPDIGFQFNSLISDELDSSYIFDKYILKKVSYCFYCYHNNISTNNLLALKENLKEDPEFQNYLSLKATDGMKFYKLSGNDIYRSSFYHIPIISGFPTLNKSDNISIKVFGLPDNRYTLIVFDIYKKKMNSNFQMYFRTLVLN